MPEETNETIESKPRKSLPVKLIVTVLVVAVVEGAGFFAASTMFGGGPKLAYGEESGENVLAGEEPAADATTVEVSVLSKFKVPNRKSGRLMLFDLDLSVKVPSARAEEMKTLVTERQSEISDRVARIVRNASPEQLLEAELKSIRVQFIHAFGEIARDAELVQEVLIPRCVPIRAD